jgi:hypothetical protein
MEIESYIDSVIDGSDLHDATVDLLFDLRRTEHWDVFSGLHDLADELEEASEEHDVDWWIDVAEAIQEYFNVEQLEAA